MKRHTTVSATAWFSQRWLMSLLALATAVLADAHVARADVVTSTFTPSNFGQYIGNDPWYHHAPDDPTNWNRSLTYVWSPSGNYVLAAYSNWSTDEYPNNTADAQYDVIINNTCDVGGPVTVNSVTLQNGNSLAVRVGTLTINSLLSSDNSTITINSAGGYNTTGALVLSPGSTLSGSGTILLRGDGANYTSKIDGAFALPASYTIKTAAGAPVTLTNATLSGGTLDSSGGAAVSLSGSNTFDNLTSNAAVHITRNSGLTVTGTLTDNGTITVNSDGGYRTNSSVVLSNATLAGTGAVLLNGDGVNFSSGITGTFTQAAGHTIGMAPGATGGLSISGTILNNGTIQANPSSGGTLTLDGTITNHGLLRACTGGTLQIASGSLTNLAGSTLTGGSYEADANSSISLPGTITVNAADVVLSGSNSQFNAINSLADNQGSFSILNGRNFTTTGNLANSGTVRVGAGSTLTVNGTYQPTAASTTLIDGSLVSAAMTIPGILGGSGTVHSHVTPASNAVLAPGNSPGTLTVDGNLRLGDGFIYNWEVSSLGHDLVRATGDLDFGESATLMVTLYGAVPPLSGDYVLFDVDGAIGQLPQWTIHLPDGVTADGVIVDGHQIVLTNLVVPEPASSLLLAIAAGAGLLRRRRRA